MRAQARHIMHHIKLRVLKQLDLISCWMANLTDRDFIGMFTIIVLPNIFLIDEVNTTILRGMLSITLGILVVWLERARVRIFLSRHLYDSLAFSTALILACALSRNPLAGLIGFEFSPIGSVIGVAAVILGVLTTSSQAVAARYIIASTVLSGCIALILSSLEGGLLVSRLDGLYEHSLAFAIFTSVGFIASWHTFLNSQRSPRMHAGISVFLMIIISLSGSRFALAASVCVAIVMFFGSKQFRHSRKAWSAFIGMGAIITTTGWLFPRLTNAAYAIESIDFRLMLYQRGIELIREHPQGIGYGNIGLYSYSPLLPSTLLEIYHQNVYIESFHNVWIDSYVAFGVIGGSILLIATFFMTRKAILNIVKMQSWPSYALLVVFANFLVTPASYTLLILCGILIRLQYTSTKQGKAFQPAKQSSAM